MPHNDHDSVGRRMTIFRTLLVRRRLSEFLGQAAMKVPSESNPQAQASQSCGYKLANDGHDTRAMQHYLGHPSIASTVRFTTLAPDRFKGFWKD
jgi:site-specific recombinase XerD